jgi:hypothetical protein
MFTNFAIVIDPLLFYWCYKLTLSCDERARTALRLSFVVWWLITKNVKLVGLYRRNIRDVWFLPLSIFFGYFHSFIKLYAALSLDQVKSPYNLRCYTNRL